MRRSKVAILGDGPVGCALALALAGGRHALRLVAAREPAREAAFRPLALSHASRLILARIGAWEAIAPHATPILAIHVSQSRGFGRTRLEAQDAGVPALGYVIGYGELLAALRECVRARGIARESAAPAAAALTVHAEGASAEANEKRYSQDAVLARIECRPSAAHTAFERFTPEGPLALLPLQGSYGLVWAMHPVRAAELAQAPEAEFLRLLAAACGARPGEPVGAAHRSRVPLALRVRAARVGLREAFIGNSAQTLHPVAGQGLNLGLRDAWALARLLEDADDPGEARLLARFARARALDARATIGVTDFLASAFLADDAASRAARGAALAALDACAPARRFFARRMIFGANALP